MNRFISIIIITIFVLSIGFSLTACSSKEQSVDTKIQNEQELQQKDMINQIGLPNITKWTEKKSMKYIYELRDRTDLICYLYYRNEFTGKFIYDGECMGYGLPYGTQYSSPEKIVDADVELNKNYTGYTAINKPLSEPNGLFPSNSTSATWVTRVGKDGKTFVDYCEPNVVITPVKKDKRMCETWSIPDNY